MEELRRLEKLQSVVSAISSHGLLSYSPASDHDASSSSRFLSELVLFLVTEKVEEFLIFSRKKCGI